MPNTGMINGRSYGMPGLTLSSRVAIRVSNKARAGLDCPAIPARSSC